MIYELRHYTSPDTTTLAATVRWFGEHAVPAWEAVGVRIVGAWTVEVGTSPRFTIILGFDDLNQRMEQFAAFYASERWKAASAAAFASGAGLTSGIDTAILQPTPYSPDPRAFRSSGRGIWEERVYRAKHARAAARLNQRFAEHTITLFRKHGIAPVAFWNVVIGADQPALYYLVRYDDLAQRQGAWANFRRDPEWQAAYAASEQDGPLLLRTTSTLLAPAPFSPMQ